MKIEYIPATFFKKAHWFAVEISQHKIISAEGNTFCEAMTNCLEKLQTPTIHDNMHSINQAADTIRALDKERIESNKVSRLFWDKVIARKGGKNV